MAYSIQLSEVLTFLLFTDLEIAHGAKVVAEANRLQYMSTGDKVNFIAQLSDRGFITINEGRELLNYQPIEGGDVLPIRGEFKLIGQNDNQIAEPSQTETPAEEDTNGSET